MEYVRFTENCCALRATWNFYIPVAGNMELFDFFMYHLGLDNGHSHRGCSRFDFSFKKRYTEREVDAFVAACQSETGGIAKSHNKLHGRSNLVEHFEEYQKTETLRYLLWDLKARPYMWKEYYKPDYFKASPHVRPEKYAKLTFSDGNADFL